MWIIRIMGNMRNYQKNQNNWYFPKNNITRASLGSNCIYPPSEIKKSKMSTTNGIIHIALLLSLIDITIHPAAKTKSIKPKNKAKKPFILNPLKSNSSAFITVIVYDIILISQRFQKRFCFYKLLDKYFFIACSFFCFCSSFAIFATC